MIGSAPLKLDIHRSTPMTLGSWVQGEELPGPKVLHLAKSSRFRLSSLLRLCEPGRAPYIIRSFLHAMAGMYMHLGPGSTKLARFMGPAASACCLSRTAHIQII